MSNDNQVKVIHTEAAQALIETIRGIRGTIPNFVIPATKADRVRLNRAAAVPADFIETTVVAVKNNPVLVRGGAGSEPDTVRDLLSFAEAYDPVAQELEALAKFLRHSTKAARGHRRKRSAADLRRDQASGETSGHGRPRPGARRNEAYARDEAPEAADAAGPGHPADHPGTAGERFVRSSVQ